MDKLDKLNRLKSAIKSGNPELIDHALEEIKNRGDDTYISPLIEFLHLPYPKEMKEKVYQLFTDLKHEDSVDALVRELENEKDLEVVERLVASCWQNGLNYSKHLAWFVKIIIEQEFQIAFEAFTVVENMYGKIGDDLESLLLEKIQNAIPEAEDRKQYLLKGLLEIIPHIPIDQDPVDF